MKRPRGLNRIGSRYMSSTELLSYAKAVGLIGPHFRGPEFLEFLERELLLVPICRVTYPDKVYRRFFNESHPPYYGDDSLPVEPDGPQYAAAHDLYMSLRSGGRGSEPIFHPLDMVDPSQAEFIQHHVASVPFRPWSEQRTLVQRRDANGDPSYRDENREHYYHYWHLIALAELFTTRRKFVLSRRRPLSFGPWWIKYRPLRWIWDRYRKETRPKEFVWEDWYRSPREPWRNHEGALDAVSVFLEYRNRCRDPFRDRVGPSRRLDPELAAELHAIEKGCAVFAMRWKGLDPAALVKCFEWLVERWDSWDSHGPPLVAEEYIDNAMATYRLFHYATGATYDQFLAALSVEGRRLFRRMLPDRVEEQETRGRETLIREIMPNVLGLKPPEVLRPTDPECVAFLQWLARRARLQFCMMIEAFLEGRGLEHRLRSPTLGATVQDMALTLEHILNDMGALKAVESHKNSWLRPKMEWFWNNQRPVLDALKKHGKELTDTREGGGFYPQQEKIRSLPIGGEYEGVIRRVLEVVLIRNQGTHVSFSGFSEDTLTGCMITLLEGSLLVWMNARARGDCNLDA